MILLAVIDQISSSRRSMLLFLITYKGSRAAQISWRAMSGVLHVFNQVRLMFQAFNYQGESVLAQDKCGEAIRALQESDKCKFNHFVKV